MARIIIAGIVGGIIMFMWSFVAHEVLPTGEMGLKSLPDDARLSEAIKSAVHEPGLYMYPGMDMTHKPTDAEMQAWQTRYETGPSGLLLCYPNGRHFNMGQLMGVEALADILAALLGAAILSQMATTYGRRLAAAIGLGIIAILLIDVSLWNWYGFSMEYVLAEAIDIVGGWLLAGLVMAAIAKPHVVVVPA